MTDPVSPQEFAALLANPQIQDLLAAVEEVLEDYHCAESSEAYVPIEDALLHDLWTAYQPFDAARSPCGLLEA